MLGSSYKLPIAGAFALCACAVMPAAAQSDPAIAARHSLHVHGLSSEESAELYTCLSDFVRFGAITGGYSAEWLASMPALALIECRGRTKAIKLPHQGRSGLAKAICRNAHVLYQQAFQDKRIPQMNSVELANCTSVASH